jgi:hypothetical protein
MAESYGGLPDLSPEELEQEFPYDSRPVHPEPEEPRPLESLAGRGQHEGTPMGLGPALSWSIAGAFLLVVLLLFGSYFYTLVR